jgi:hypothetical protein
MPEEMNQTKSRYTIVSRAFKWSNEPQVTKSLFIKFIISFADLSAKNWTIKK